MAKKNDGLYKRCGCARRQWIRCSHPWHFDFYKGRKYRFSLAKLSGRTGFMSKTEAQELRDLYRSQIRAGTFVDLSHPEEPSPDTPLTFGDVADLYLEQHVRIPTRRVAAQKTMTWYIGELKRAEIPAGRGASLRLETKPLNMITKADIEGIRRRRRELAGKDLKNMRVRPGVRGGEVGTNRLLARLRHMFNWSIEQGLIDSTPFKRQGVTVIRLESRVEGGRHRRLAPGEEERLLRNARNHLRALIIALLSTGCRIDELLSLPWKRIRRDENDVPRWIVLPSTNTKTYELRAIPIGVRLRAELEMRQHAPDGTEFGAEAFVFGNAVGERVGSVKTAWAGTCRRAGISGLQTRDLRREFASRLRESGASDHDVRDFLGHANITTTSRYLASTPLRLEQALANLEAVSGLVSVTRTTERSGERGVTRAERQPV